MTERTSAAKPSYLNELLDHRLIRETVSVSNSAQTTTKTTTYPSGAQQKDK
jgi:hypothetical protein